MDGGNRRPPLLPAGQSSDFGRRMAEQNLDQFQCRVPGRSQNADAYHAAIPRTKLLAPAPAGPAKTDNPPRRFTSRQPQEYPLLRPGQILFTFFHFAANKELARAMIRSKATCIAYETVEDEGGHLPILVPMSEVAGRMSVQ